MTGRRTIITLCGVLVTVGLVLSIAGMLMGGARPVYLDGGGLHATNNEEANSVNRTVGSMDLGEFKNINVSVISAGVELRRSDKNRVEYDMNGSEQVVKCEVEGDALTFKTEAKWGISIFGFGERSSKVTIYYNGDEIYEDVNLSSVSGSVKTQDIRAERFASRSTSGSQSLSGITGGSAEVGGVSGSVKLDNLKCKTVQLKSVSGSIQVRGVDCEELSASNTSGSVKVESADITDSLSVRGGSGSISVDGAVRGTTELSNISGSIKVRVKGNMEDYGYRLSNVSGSSRVNGEKLAGSVNEGRENQINLKSTSGSLSLDFE